MDVSLLILVTVVPLIHGQGSGDVQKSLDACTGHQCTSPIPFCNVIYTDGESDSSECLASCPSPSISNQENICQDYCSQPQNPCADNSLVPYCHRQNTGDKYRCIASCTGVLSPATPDNICTDACSPNPCTSPNVCTPAANGQHTCSVSCTFPRVKDSGNVCVDPCLPSGCPSSFLCKRLGSERDCLYGSECPSDHYIDTSNSLCVDGCANNQCVADSKVCTRQSTSPGYTCSSKCPYPTSASGNLCVDPCQPTNPCPTVKFCERNGLNYSCVAKDRCAKNFYSNTKTATCEDPCQENPCKVGRYCHRQGNTRSCRSKCTPGYTAENNNPFICQKATTLQSSTVLAQTYTSDYEGGSGSPQCQGAFEDVLTIVGRGLNSLNAGRSFNQGCRRGSVVVDMATEFISTSDVEPANVTSEILSEALANSFEEFKNSSNATYFSNNGTIYFPSLDVSINVINSTDAIDFDECQNETYYFCPEFSTCNNTNGGYVCNCDSGYESYGSYCRAIDECLKTINCDVNAYCVDQQNAYDCICKDGFSGNGITCQEIDECSGNNDCLVNQTCQNYQGGYTCSCPTGQFNVSNSCSVIYTYRTAMTVYQDSTFEAIYFTKDQNNQLLDENSYLYHTFGQQFCELVTSSLDQVVLDYEGCKVAGYSVKKASRKRRAISGADEITVSFDTYFTKTHKAADLQSSLVSAAIYNNTEYFNFYNIKTTTEFPIFEAVCQQGETSTGDYCEVNSQPSTNECAGGCAENAVCVAESGKLLCTCVYGYTGNGKTKCIMSDMNRLRWILVGVNSVLLASLIIIIACLVRTKKRITEERYRKSEVLVRPRDLRFYERTDSNTGSPGLYRVRQQARDFLNM